MNLFYNRVYTEYLSLPLLPPLLLLLVGCVRVIFGGGQ